MPPPLRQPGGAAMTAVFIPSHRRQPRRAARPRFANIFAVRRREKSFSRHDSVVTEPCNDPESVVTEPCNNPDFTTTPARRSPAPGQRLALSAPRLFVVKTRTCYQRQGFSVSSSAGGAPASCRARHPVPPGANLSNSPPGPRQNPSKPYRNLTMARREADRNRRWVTRAEPWQIIVLA